MLAGMQVNESHPRASLKVSEGGIIPFRRARPVPTPPSPVLQRNQQVVGACCLLREPSPPCSGNSLLSSVHEAVKSKKGRLGSWSRCGCMPRGPYGQGDKFIIVFGRRQPSTIHPIAFHRLVCIRIEERALDIDRDPPSRPPGFLVPT